MSSEPALDRLAAPLQVVQMSGWKLGAIGADEPVRDPHRHDYHELIWVRSGSGEHRIDGRTVPAVAGTITVIGRGQVHVFMHADAIDGAVVRFSDELLLSPSARVLPDWLLAGGGGRTVVVPPDFETSLSGLITALAAEAERPPDLFAADLQRHLIATVMLWIERWTASSRTESRDAEDADLQLHRRFARVLEHDYARHHDAAHYADALAVPAPALARSLRAVTGRSTKELITGRIMLEAQRLLRFTDRTVGEVAYAVGFEDPLYFSRAFKRASGEPPQTYRDRTRGL